MDKKTDCCKHSEFLSQCPLDDLIDDIKYMIKKAKEMEAALIEINRKDTYSEKSFGPFAEIARRGLGK